MKDLCYKWCEGSPKEVALPPVGFSVVAVHVDEELPGFLPAEEGDGEGHSWNAKQEER